MSLIRGVLSEAGTTDLTDQYHQLTLITTGTWVTSQSEDRKEGFGISTLYKDKYM